MEQNRMSESLKYFASLTSRYQSTAEEKACADVLYNDVDIHMGDKRLNSIAALTWNAQSCQRIFAMLEKAISPTENPWKTIYKAILIIHTILLYGSELSVDKCVDICKFVFPMQHYNSALVKKGFFVSGGTDYGAPVRAASKELCNILMKDETIRKARNEARAKHNTLVPMGELPVENINPSIGQSMTYGQGLTSSVGAGFGLEAVPGMYEGRPERYFDNHNDTRRNYGTNAPNHQITRDKQAPSLLDLVFDDIPAASVNPNLPQPEYLPGLEKQRDLERQLAEQQELLRQLQQQQQQQQQQQYAPAPAPAPASAPAPKQMNLLDDLFSLQPMPATATTTTTAQPFQGQQPFPLHPPAQQPQQQQTYQQSNAFMGMMPPTQLPSQGQGYHDPFGGFSMGAAPSSQQPSYGANHDLLGMSTNAPMMQQGPGPSNPYAASSFGAMQPPQQQQQLPVQQQQPQGYSSMMQQGNNFDLLGGMNYPPPQQQQHPQQQQQQQAPSQQMQYGGYPPQAQAQSQQAQFQHQPPPQQQQQQGYGQSFGGNAMSSYGMPPQQPPQQQPPAYPQQQQHQMPPPSYYHENTFAQQQQQQPPQQFYNHPPANNFSDMPMAPPPPPPPLPPFQPF